ncbi:MAG: helix-turn-helix domain-containing protein [Ramlibacter sp.]|jgi:AcrR family transcriptional regulator
MPDLDAPATEHRHRLLEGMARAVAAKGYADTTIADIVREAAVSRRTFYEHFGTKADCLMALYEAASHNALKVLRHAIDPARSWQTQVEQAMAAYLGCLALNPTLLRTLFIEILGIGAPGLAVRRRMNAEIAGFMQAVINADGRERISPAMAMAVVGGVHELVLQAIEDDRLDSLQALAGPASALVRAVTGAVR